MKKFEKLLIDTSALIEYMRGNRQAKELINSVDIAERYLPHIATAELYHGQYRLGKSRSDMFGLEGVIAAFRLLLSDAETSHYFGQVKSAFTLPDKTSICKDELQNIGYRSGRLG